MEFYFHSFHSIANSTKNAKNIELLNLKLELPLSSLENLDLGYYYYSRKVSIIEPSFTW